MENTKETVSLKYILLMIVVAYVFAVGIRFIWVEQFSGIPQYMWNDEIMINTNDGYFFAEGARDILRGQHEVNDLSPVELPLSKLTAFLATVLPFSFETIILYMPAFFGSLLVVPVFLIGRALGRPYMGFIAALLAGITWSYYNRTMVGYYDTDMLTIVLPTVVLWTLILGVTHNENRYLILVPLAVILYHWWYSASYSLNLGMAGILFIYILIFDRKNLYNYKLLTFMLIAISNIPIVIKIALVIALYSAFLYLKEKLERYVYALLGASVVLVFLTGGFDPLLSHLKGYVFREAIAADTPLSLKFFNVAQTVREAGAIPFETFANRISGSEGVFVLSLIGYILMVIHYPVMLLALPMLGLGLLAYGIPGLIPPAGLRFTVYAVPVASLAIAFIILLVSRFFGTFFVEKSRNFAVVVFASIMTATAVYPNIKHVVDYKVPTVFTKSEVEVLDKLQKIAGREDYVISWWDYGYPIRFYSDVKTLVDGGKHSGEDNFPTSFVLTHPQEIAAKMARLNVEYTEVSFLKQCGSSIECALKSYRESSATDFIDKLANDKVTLPEKSREIYFYLPSRMLNIFPTVALFSNLDIDTGQKYPDNFFYATQNFSEAGEFIDLGNGIRMNKSNGTLTVGGKPVPLKSFTITRYDAAGKLHKQEQALHRNGVLAVIYMQNYNQMLVMTEKMYDSLFIQLFVLENSDDNLFEPVILTPLAKVYKLKI